MYNEIKRNFIDRYFNRIYKYTVVSNRKVIIDDINKRLPFNSYFDDSYDHLYIDLGDGIEIQFNLNWEYIDDGKRQRYKLVSIS